jgi:hypothetical protein
MKTKEYYMSITQIAIIAVTIVLGAVIFFTAFRSKNKSTEIPFDEQLRRLEALRKENLISESEYNEKRKKIMDA